MELHKFSFGVIEVIQENLAEITVNGGVDIDVEMVDELHHLMLTIFSHSFSLLINKSNSYSTQLVALDKFGKLPQIKKIAVFAPNKMAQLSADFAANIPSSAVLDIKVFTDKEEALTWLQ